MKLFNLRKLGLDRRAFYSALLAVALLLAACGGGAAPTESQNPQGEAPAEQPTAEPPTQSAGLCSNLYFPVVVGATWAYAGTSNTGGDYAFTETITEVRADGFTMTGTFEDLTRTQEWTCTANGLVALQFDSGASAGISAAGLDAVFETTASDGVTLPASLAAGNTWTQNFTLHGDMNIEGGITATADGTVNNNFQAIGVESVSVPAGTFEAMRVEMQTTFSLTATVSGIGIPITFTATTVSWYAPGVGWMKSESSGGMAGVEAATTTIELQSYTIP